MSTAAEFNANGYIEITGCDLPQLLMDVYNNSSAQGMGFLHFVPEEMTRAQAEKYLAEEDKWYKEKGYERRTPLDLDYLQGRACKFNVFTASDDKARWFIPPSWYDHSPMQLYRIVAKHAPTCLDRIKDLDWSLVQAT